MKDEEIERIRNSKSKQGTSSKTTETNLNFDEIFCMKRKSSGKNLLDNINLTKCEGPSCTATNVDMIKCIRCHKFVCEECNDIPVNKLKLIMKKCSTIYFKCKSCNDEDKGASSIPVISNNDSSTEPTPQNETPSQVPNKRQNVVEIIDRKFEELENKFNKNLSEKLAREFEKLNEKLTKIPDKIEQKYESFKDVVAGNVNTPASATNFKQIMTEERNEQLIQERERKRRATNVIVHGVKEEGDSNDKSFVEELLVKIGITTVPESVVRLGMIPEVPVANKVRPIKIRFKLPEEKDNMMSRLSNLKRAEDKFRKISITDDYTIEERQEIKKFVDEAKRRNETEEGNFFWRTRGSPKTGLELRRVPKRSQSQDS